MRCHTTKLFLCDVNNSLPCLMGMFSHYIPILTNPNYPSMLCMYVNTSTRRKLTDTQFSRLKNHITKKATTLSIQYPHTTHIANIFSPPHTPRKVSPYSNARGVNTPPHLCGPPGRTFLALSLPPPLHPPLLLSPCSTTRAHTPKHHRS